MVGEGRVASVVVHWHRGLAVVASHLVADQVLLELGVSGKKHSVAPGRDSHFLRSVVHLAVVVVLVGWVEVQRALLEFAENHVALFYFQKLVLTLQPLVVFLVDQLTHLIIGKVHPEIEVSEEALVVVVALLLRVVDREVIERVIVNLPHVLHSLVYRILATLEVSVDEREGGVLEAEPDGHRTLVASHAGKARFDLDLAQTLQFGLVLLLGEHDDVAANHDFLDDGDITDPLRVSVQCLLDDLLPDPCSLFVFAFDHLGGVQGHHLLHPDYENVRHPTVVIVQQALDLVFWVWWGIACAVPTVDRNLELRLFDVDLLVLHQLLFERAPDSVWLLQPGVFPNQKLDALVLEVVIHHALVVASYTHAPLLKLAYDSLATLLCNPRDITLRASVLETQTITISHKYITNCIKYWA